MRMFFAAPALAACVFATARAHAAAPTAPPKLVLDDVIGVGPGGTFGWFSYSRVGTGPDALGNRSRQTSLRIAPRFEVLFGKYVSLGAELSYAHYSYASGNAAGETSQSSDAITLVPLLGGRLPLPRGLSLWAHAGFGGGAAVQSTSGFVDDGAQAQLLTRFRADLRVAYEPTTGLLLSVGPDLQRTAAGKSDRFASMTSTTVGLFGGVSFVIR